MPKNTSKPIRLVERGRKVKLVKVNVGLNDVEAAVILPESADILKVGVTPVIDIDWENGIQIAKTVANTFWVAYEVEEEED